MAAAISDCKKVSWRKIKQVISAEREWEGGMEMKAMWYLQTCPSSSLVPAVSTFSHTCADASIKAMRRALCSNSSLRCAAALLWEVMTVCKLCSSGFCVCVSSCHRLVYQAGKATRLLHLQLLFYHLLLLFSSFGCLYFPDTVFLLSFTHLFLFLTESWCQHHS